MRQRGDGSDGAPERQGLGEQVSELFGLSGQNGSQCHQRSKKERIRLEEGL
jgi:hypothetical protein